MSDAQLVASDGGVRSIARAVDLLSLFDADHPHRTLRELVDASGLPKTTVVRLLATLAGDGLVSEHGDASFTLGAGFLRWVRLTQGIWDVGPAVRRAMRELSDACGETINIYVRQGDTRVCIAQEEGQATVRSVVPVGVPLPLTAGAAAAVLLSGAPERFFDSVAHRATDPKRLRRAVAAAAERGFAVTHGERELGASAVATPILGSARQVIAALSVSGPTPRFTSERVDIYIEAAISAAARISEIGLQAVEANL